MPFSRPWRDGPSDELEPGLLTPDPFPFSLRGSRSLCISTRLWLLHGRHIPAKYPDITSVTFLDSFTWDNMVWHSSGEETCYWFKHHVSAASIRYSTCYYDKAWSDLKSIVSDLLRQIWPSIEFTGGQEPANDGQEHENKGGG